MRLFDDEASLVSMINSLPQLPGRAKGPTGEMVDSAFALKELKLLVPRIFRYRDLLSSTQGGLGNLKSVRKYSVLVAEKLSREAQEEYEASLNELSQEIESLTNLGVSEDTTGQLRSAKTQVAQFKSMSEIIMGFCNSLQLRMKGVEGATSNMLIALKTAIKQTPNAELKEELKKVHRKIEDDLEEIQDLIRNMDLYCRYQVTYNSIVLGALSAA